MYAKLAGAEVSGCVVLQFQTHLNIPFEPAFCTYVFVLTIM